MYLWMNVNHFGNYYVQKIVQQPWLFISISKFSTDILAVSLERICNQCGISIPEDLSIISFNDSLFAKLTSPQLTSIDVNSFQLGIEAASQLINHIENPNLLATKIIVPHRIIERDSCKKIF